MIPVFHGLVHDHVFEFDNRSQFNDYLKTLDGKRCELTVRKARSKRSVNQNNYYFGIVCKTLGDYFGYEVDEMHEALKLKFLQIGPCDVPTIKSTTKLNTAEFEYYLERIRRWAAAEYSVVVPLPNEAEAA